MLDMKIPSKLYKYQPCESYALNNLREKQIWFSKPESFNDPFDSDINFALADITDKNLKPLFDSCRESAPDKNAFDSKYIQGGKINDKFRDDIVSFTIQATEQVKQNQWKQKGIACFSEENDNLLMWSHYARGHQGFCLEFDTSFSPFKSIKTQNLLKVSYPETNLYPPLSIKDIPHNLPSLVKTQLGTKSFHWHYENEWRIFASIGNKSYSFEKAALAGVYLGCRMKDEDKNTIATILADSPTRLYQMERSKTEFKVVAKEIYRPALTH